MYKKTLIYIVFAVLSGCDDSGNTSTEINSAKVESNKSTTAVYFQGGGVDFGREPIIDNSKKDEFGTHIGSIKFVFDESVEKISKETSVVMIAQGFSEKKTTSDKCKPCMVYSKNKFDIAFVYSPQVLVGNESGSQLHMWWKEKK